MVNYNEMSTEALMTELRAIASLAFPGDVAKQNAGNIVVILRERKTKGGK